MHRRSDAQLNLRDGTPKFLSSGLVKVVRNDESYFDKWKTWEEYDHPETGFRSIIKRELEDFREGHRQQVEERLELDKDIISLGHLVLG